MDGETCTLTVSASQVTDQDATTRPTTWRSTSPSGSRPFDVCAAPYTPIPRSRAPASLPRSPGTVTTKGVVVGDFEGTAASSGFYIQDPAGDGDPATSDGIFVFTGNADLVSAGQVVRVTGFARERFDQTTINGSNSNSAAVPAAQHRGVRHRLGRPHRRDDAVRDRRLPERYEGMLVRFPQPLVIAEYFNYDRFGEIVLALPLAGETRPFTGTAIDEPGAAGQRPHRGERLQPDHARRRAERAEPGGAAAPERPAVLADQPFRGGDTVANTVGVLGYDFSLYRIPDGPADYTAVNPRPAAPEPVGGRCRSRR